ncbi:MAG: hypothetical protein K8R92_02475 [Planctomycetes bacterium]|nr:hypothetical protein [Planctomycetota bacterium]
MFGDDKLLPLFLLHDEPIFSHTENYFEGDPFSRTVARAALGTKGPFTIGVYGEWGSGKTSVLHAARTMINADSAWSHVVTVEFNAWRYEREEFPIVPLVATIEREVAAKCVSLKARDARNHAEQIGWYEKAGMHCRALLAGFQFKLKPEIKIPFVGSIAAEATWSAKDTLEQFAKLQNELRTLDNKLWFSLSESCLSLSTFDALDKVGSAVSSAAGDTKHNWPLVVVFIDDLDRCQPEKAFELLENVKLVLCQAGFVFVLALNHIVVDAYLSHLALQRYGKDNAHVHKSYLDKIVQLPLHMSPRGERFVNFAEELLDKRLAKAVGHEIRLGLKDLAKVLALSANRTPRSLVRRINTALIDIALRDPTNLPNSLKSELPPYQIFSGLCIVQRTLEATIGVERTRELAEDQELCDLLNRKNIFEAIKDVHNLLNPRKIKDDRKSHLKGDSKAINILVPTESSDPGRAERWNTIVQAIYREASLYKGDRDSQGNNIANSSMLTSKEAQRWLSKHEERQAIMRLTVQRPELEPSQNKIIEIDSDSLPATPDHSISGASSEIIFGKLPHKERAIIELKIFQHLELPSDSVLDQRKLSQVTELDFSGDHVTDAGVAWLAKASTNLKSLTSLNLSHTKVTDVGVKELTASDTGLKNVTSLDLSHTEATDVGVRDLADSDSGLKILTSLDLGHTEVTDIGVKEICRKDTGLSTLTRLDLSSTNITDIGVMELSKTDTALKALDCLNLCFTEMTDAGMKELTRADSGLRSLNTLFLLAGNVTNKGWTELSRADTGLKSLTTLLLFNSQISDAGMKELTRPETGLKSLTNLTIYELGTKKGLLELARTDTGLASLTSLTLFNTPMNDEILKEFTRANTGLKTLTTLNLFDIDVTDVGVMELAREDSGLESLVSLSLRMTKVTDIGIGGLARPNTGLNSLTSLDLCSSKVTNAGISELARPNTGIKNLTSLDLSMTEISDEGIYELAHKSTGLRSLNRLYLSRTKVTKDGIEIVKKRWPGIKIFQ